jgi:acetylornithine deacetylase/succinyl-diaminopimelate desuccinylase-like protein
MYTPRLQRGDDLRDHPNAIVKAASVIDAIEKWAVEFAAKRSGPTPCGPVIPQAQIGAIRGGIPWRPNRSSPYCALYLDVRTLPGEDPDEVTASLREALNGVEVDSELELIMSKPGQLGEGIEPLRDAITAAHRTIRGGEPRAEAEASVVSMWRDTNVFNQAGIPAINFGPSRGEADVQGRGYLELDDMVDAAKMYALIAMRISGGFDIG